MDVGVLRDRIRTTLDPNADARRQAELDLRFVSLLNLSRYPLLSFASIQAEEQPGFINALLNILQAEHDHGIRLSSTIPRS